MSTQSKRRFRIIGQRTPKVDAVDKVTGRALFGADVSLPRMLVGKVLRSPLAHARIRSIDTSKAEDLPGVKAVITGRDLPALTPGDRAPSGTITPADCYRSEETLARDKVLFHGHAVAAVAATSAEAAEKALALIDVRYEELSHVLDPIEAMKPGAVLLHDDLHTKEASGASVAPSNIGEHLEYRRGDVQAGFADADTVVERTFKTQVVHQGYVEPDSEAAQVDADGRVTVWANTQAIYAQRISLAVTLDIPLGNIKVVPTEVGGAFGGKETARVSTLCVALARKAGRPVRITLSREEVFRGTGPGNAIVATVKVGARRDGTITAIQGRFVFDAGGFPGAPISSAIRRVFSIYRTANLKIDAYDVLTNKPHVGSYRAPGGTPTAFALESVMDDLADALHIDPLEFRLQNVSRAGDPMPDGLLLSTVSLVQVLERVKRHPCWTTPISGPDRGRGIGLGLWNMPGGMTSCHIVLSGDGSVTLVIGTVDLSGTRTSLAVIAAEYLGLELADVRVVIGDTDMAAYSDPSAGDKVTYVMSKAVQQASHDLLAQLRQLVAEDFHVPAEDVVYELKRFWVEGAPEMKKTLEEVALRSVRGKGAVIGHGSANYPAGPVAIAPNAAAHVVDVEVDRETGKIQILAYTTFQDVGLSINPGQVEGQMQGGATQGIGWALSEGYVFDENGVMINASLLDYRLPTTLDVPFIGTEVLEEASPDHPLGIRAVGQVPIVPPAGAIGNAVRNAVGVRLCELPMNPERVFWALKKADEQGSE